MAHACCSLWGCACGAQEESIVNRLQRQLELLLGSIRLIEGKLEAKGITMKDLGITPFEFAAPE